MDTEKTIEAHLADLEKFRPVLTKTRRLITLGVANGKPWYRAATVGDVAQATKLPPEEVVRLIRECGWLMEVDEEPGQPVENWIVWEDGV